MCIRDRLRADEIECRVTSISERGVQLVLYKDARCDRRILDETFGIYGWQNKYEVINGNLFCTISVWDADNKQWVSKSDCGTESYTEKEKGEASDAFKRASYALGIGRELYTRLHIFVKCETIADNNKTKYKLKNFEKWTVTSLEVDQNNEKITGIEIADKNGVTVYSYGNVDNKHLKCARCNKKITVEEHDNSVRRFKKPLCEACQKAAMDYFTNQKKVENENQEK